MRLRNKALRSRAFVESLEQRQMLSVTTDYSTNFSTSTLGNEWDIGSGQHIEWGGEGYIYNEGENTISLSVDDLTPHTDLAISFVFQPNLTFGMWAPNGDEDIFEVKVDGEVVYRETYISTGEWLDDGEGGWFWFPNYEVDIEFLNGAYGVGYGTFALQHTGSTAEIEFIARELEPSRDNENWHLDDVTVSTFIPTVSISGGGTVAEDGQPVELTVSRDANPWRTGAAALPELTVNVSVGGTATSGQDYTANPSGSTVTIASGVSSASFSVAPILDALSESNETVTLTAVAGTGYSLGTSVTSTVTITNTLITLESLTVSSAEGSGATGTVSDSNPRSLRVESHFDSSLSADVSVLDISGVYSPNSSSAASKVRWAVINPSGTKIVDETFEGTNTVTIIWSGSSDIFEVVGGVDSNENGVLDAGEITRMMQVAKADVVILKARSDDDDDTAELNARNGTTTVNVSGEVNGAPVPLPASVTATVSTATPLPAGASLTIQSQSVAAGGVVKVIIKGTGFTAPGTYSLILDIPDDQNHIYMNCSIKIVVP